MRIEALAMREIWVAEDLLVGEGGLLRKLEKNLVEGVAGSGGDLEMSSVNRGCRGQC